MKKDLVIEDFSILKDMRTIIIGDIHGCYDQLMNLLDKCVYKNTDLIVLVGDLTDRGPKPVEVLKWCLNNHNVRCVQGNHDNKLMRFINGNSVNITNGLQFTSTKINQLSSKEKNEIFLMIKSMPNIIRIQNFNEKPSYVVHAGIDGRIPILQQKVEDTLYMRGINGKNYMDIENGMWHDTISGEYNVLCGHIVSDIVNPRESIYCLDGGCCSGGVLRALIVDNGKTEIVEVDGLDILNNVDQIELREKLAGQGLIRTDRIDDLVVYTYTDKVAHDRLWDMWPILRESRGHIFNTKTRECVAYTFSKFFNLNENKETQKNKLPWGSGYQIFEKIDGWLGTLYRHNGEFKIATRGSFKSEGAIWATKWLQDNIDLSNLEDDLTLVFEIVSQTTKIIIDYKTQGLILLSAFNRHTGKELSWDSVQLLAKEFGFKVPKVYTSIDECFNILESEPGNKIEGFVIKFLNGTRIKIKNKDYFRISRLMKNLSPKNIWKTMSNGKVDRNQFENLGVSTSICDLAIDTASLLETQYLNIMMEIKDEFYKILSSIEEYWQVVSNNKPGLRRDFALLVNKKNCPYKSAMFMCFDNQNEKLSEYVKKLIRPTKNFNL